VAFAAAFGGNRLTQITGEDIEDWIETDLGYDNPHTFNNWRKHIRTFFDHYRKQVHQNPCDDIRTRNDDTEHVGILTPMQAAKLFSHALTENRRHLIGRLALEAFAGLRFASAYRLEKADINFKDLGLLLPNGWGFRSNARFPNRNRAKNSPSNEMQSTHPSKLIFNS
jgi:hypothetical protein